MSAGNSDFQTKRSELLTRVTAEKEKIDECMALLAVALEKQKEWTKKRNDLKALRKKLGYWCTDICKIDCTILEIERFMVHSSLTLKEEKKYMLEIAQLKKGKPEVWKCNQLEMAYATGEVLSRGECYQINEVMNVHRERKKELSAEFADLLAERDAQMGNSQVMYQQCDELNNEVKEDTQERNALRDPFQNMAHRAPSSLVLTIVQLDGSNRMIDNLCPDHLVDDLYRVVGEVLQIPAPNLTLVVGMTMLPNFSGQPLRSVGLTSQASVIAIRNKVLYLGYSDAAVAELLKDMDDEIVAIAVPAELAEFCWICCDERNHGGYNCGCSCCLCFCEESGCGIDEPASEPPWLSDCRLMCKDKRTSMFEIGRLKKNKQPATSHSRVGRMDRKTIAKHRRIRFGHDQRLCCAPTWHGERRSEMKRHMDKHKDHKDYRQAFAELEDTDVEVQLI